MRKKIILKFAAVAFGLSAVSAIFAANAENSFYIKADAGYSNFKLSVSIRPTTYINNFRISYNP
jgi:hypothetical protein